MAKGPDLYSFSSGVVAIASESPSFAGARLSPFCQNTVNTISCPLSVCATMETTSNEYLHRLRECMPILLCTYWTLAAGAAAFALLPVDLAPGVRCCNACVPDHLLLHKQIKQPKCVAETQYSSQQREASYVTTALERSWAASPTSWSHSNGFYISMLPDQSATPACFIVS